MVQTPDTDPQIPEPNSQFTEEAQQLVSELAQKPGKKALILIVDDIALKRQGVLDILKNRADTREAVGYAFSAKATGEDTIGLYEAFRRADSQENPTPVILILDSVLARRTEPTPYKLGGDVADRIMQISVANGWQKPYIVGNATENVKHKEWANLYGEHFLIGYVDDSIPVFDAIETKL